MGLNSISIGKINGHPRLFLDYQIKLTESTQRMFTVLVDASSSAVLGIKPVKL
jgi:hypothetical protein